MELDLEKLRKRAAIKDDITDVVLVGVAKDELNQLLDRLEKAETKLAHVRDELEDVQANTRGAANLLAQHLIVNFLDNPHM